MSKLDEEFICSTLDARTWGKFRSSISLAKILNELGCGKVRDSVARIVGSSFKVSKEIFESNLPRSMKLSVLVMYKKQHLSWVKNKSLPQNVDTHTRNVVNTIFKNKLRILESTSSRRAEERNEKRRLL